MICVSIYSSPQLNSPDRIMPNSETTCNEKILEKLNIAHGLIEAAIESVIWASKDTRSPIKFRPENPTFPYT